MENSITEEYLPVTTSGTITNTFMLLLLFLMWISEIKSSFFMRVSMLD